MALQSLGYINKQTKSPVREYGAHQGQHFRGNKNMPDYKQYKQKHSLKGVFVGFFLCIFLEVILFLIVDKSLDVLAYGY